MYTMLYLAVSLISFKYKHIRIHTHANVTLRFT